MRIRPPALLLPTFLLAVSCAPGKWIGPGDEPNAGSAGEDVRSLHLRLHEEVHRDAVEAAERAHRDPQESQAPAPPSPPAPPEPPAQ